MNTHTRPSFWSAVGIVAQREIKVRFMSKAFLVSTGVLLGLNLLFVVFMPMLVDSVRGGPPVVAVAAEHAETVRQLPDVEVLEVADDAAARQAVLDEEAKAAVVTDSGNPIGIKVLGRDVVPDQLMMGLSVSPSVELVGDGTSNPFIRYFMALGFGVVWSMSGALFGMSIAQSVVEEKQTRIVEILLASVSSRALLTGKVIGNSIPALVQIVLLVGAFLLGLTINGNLLPLEQLLWPILTFAVYFIVGFVMLASLYAATAALVSRTEDLQSAAQPMTLLLLLPYIAVPLGNANDTAMNVMSYIPFTSPVAMPVQMYLGKVGWVEVSLSLAILLATTIVAILVASRVYDRGLLQTGKPMKWREALAKAE